MTQPNHTPPGVVPPYRIAASDRLILDGTPYRFRQRLDGGFALSRCDDPGIVEEFTHQHLHALMEKPGFRFERGHFDIARIKAHHRSDASILADIPVEEHDSVLYRYKTCQIFLRLEAAGKASRSDRSIKAITPLIHAELKAEAEAKARKFNGEGKPIPPRAGDPSPSVPKAPSPRTLRNWILRLEDAGMRAVALRKRMRLCGDRLTQRYTRDELAVMAEYAILYASENRPSMRDVHRLLKAEIEKRNDARSDLDLPPLRLPSYERFAKEIRSIPAFDVHAGRYGLMAAMKKYAMVANGPDVERPLQRVEMDEWRVDLFSICRDAGILSKLSDRLKEDISRVRPWLCVAVDVASKVFLGMRMGVGADTVLALETLEMVVSTKKALAETAGALAPWDFCGNPETVVTDQGAALLSKAVRGAIIALEAEPDSPPAGLAHLRGTMERAFKTAGMQALAPFPGRTFGSIRERGDYNPRDRAVLEIQELCQVLVRWVVDVYHQSPHAGLGGETPANAWARLVKKFGIIPPPDRHTRRAIFGIPLKRALTPRGVRVLALHYNCVELQEHRRRHGDCALDVRVDPLDLGHVSVRLGDAGWLAVPCMRPGLDDVTIETWRLAAADLRRRFAAEAKLNDAIVGAAIRDAWELAAQVQAREGILSVRPSPEQLDHAEELLGSGFPHEVEIASGSEPLGPDLIARAIPTRVRTVTPPTAIAPKTSRKIKFED